MNASKIPAMEVDFKANGIDAVGNKHTLTAASVDGLDYVKCDSANSGYYYQEATEKKRIVLHFTEGYLKGDISSLTKPDNKVSVPFVIARDGTIYNLFPSKYWSYHLGMGAVGGNTICSKSSLAIELSNIGPLKLIGENLVTNYSDTDVYCSVNETDLFTELETPYRDFKYYAKFTDAQYDSLVQLLKFLCNRYSIPANFLAIEKRFDLFASNGEAVDFNGICSHVNFRPIGEKVDIGPAFDWDKIEGNI